MNTSELFKTLSTDIQTLQWRYFHALTALNIFETFKTLKSPPHAGKYKVQKNLTTLNHYLYFFQMAEEANRFYFFVEISKYFDKDDRTLSLYRVINEIEANRPILTKDNFLLYRRSIGQPVIKELENTYRPVTAKDITIWRRSLQAMQPIIDKIRKYRSQALAHDDYNKTFQPISRSEILKLFKVLSKLLNKMSLKIDFSTTSRLNAKEATRDVRRLIDDLHEFREYKLKSV